jgi:hypothetical protein
LNVLKLHLQTTVLKLLAAGKNQRDVERITSIYRKTIRRYQRRLDKHANFPGVTTGRTIQIPPPQPPATTGSACEVHRAFIEAQLRRKRNYTAIYQDLVNQFGFCASYNSVKRFARNLREHDPAQFDRLEFAPSEEV